MSSRAVERRWATIGAETLPTAAYHPPCVVAAACDTGCVCLGFICVRLVVLVGGISITPADDALKVAPSGATRQKYFPGGKSVTRYSRPATTRSKTMSLNAASFATCIR